MRLLFLALCLIAPFLRAFKYYSLDQAVILDSSTDFTTNDFALKFHQAQEAAYIVGLSVSGFDYDLYYYPQASQLCIQSSRGASLLNVDFQGFISLNFTQSAATFNYFYIKENSALSCSFADVLKDTHLYEVVAELRLSNAMADTFETQLSSLTELPQQSCTTQVSSICTECLDGFKLDGSNNCSKHDHNPQRSSLMGASNGQVRSAASAEMGSIWMAQINASVVSFAHFVGQTALVSADSFSADPQISLTGISGPYTIQFYLMLLPSSSSQTTSVFYDIFKIEAGADQVILKLEYEYRYAYSPHSVNSLQAYLHSDISSTAATSNKISIPLGEWLMFTIYTTGSSVYNLQVEKYGSVSLTGAAYFVPSTITLTLNSPKLIYFLRELLIWNQDSSTNSDISSHQCRQFAFNSRLTHPGTFSPLIRFPLDYDPSSADTNMVDTQPLGVTVPLIFKSSLTVGSQIEDHQPSAVLSTNYYFSDTSSLPACIECSPGCTTCTSMSACSSCSSGTLTNGICFDLPISPPSGHAFSTTFTLDVYRFQDLNYHAISGLRLNPLQDYITIDVKKIRYPDSTEQTITTNDYGEFYVPKYRLVGATSFNAQFVVVYSFGGSTYETIVTTLIMTQDKYTPAEALKDDIQTAQVSQSEENLCGCSIYGICNELTGNCICDQNYEGHYCDYQVTQLLQFQNQVSSMLNTIEANLASFSTYDALQELDYLTEEADALVQESTLKCFDLLDTVFTDYTNSTEVDRAFEVLSHLSTKASEEEGSALEYTTRLKSTLDRVVESSIAANTSLNIHSSKIHTQSIYFEEEVPSQEYLPSNSSATSVSLPTSLPYSQSRRWLVSILYDQHIYESRAPASRVSSSEVLTLELYVDGVVQRLSDLEQPILMKFAIDKSNTLLMKEVNDVLDGLKDLDSIRCYYFDVELQVPWQAGCTLVGVTRTEMTCACDHMTDFMGFLKTGLDVIKEGNYNALLAITKLNARNLRHNLGLFFALGVVGSFFLLLIISLIIDHVHLRSHFFDKLYLLVHKVPVVDSRHEDSVFIILDSTSKSREEVDDFNKKKQRRVKPMAQDSTATDFKLTKKEPKKEAYGPDEIDSKEVLQEIEFDSFSSQPDKSAIDSSPVETQTKRNSTFLEKKHERSSFSKGAAAASPTSKSSYTVRTIKDRVSKIIESEKQRHCCCVFQKLVRNELATNNQAYNLITKTSPLNRRATRLTLCYFALVVEFATCAFFFNLSPNSPNVPLFWDRIIENFWVAVYSTLFLMIPLLIVGCLFTFPEKDLRILRKATYPQDMQFQYRKVVRKMKSRLIGGFIMLSLLIYFLLIYIICFCHIASNQMQQDWLVSSSLSIVLDLVVMEVAPAILVGGLGVIASKCGRRSGLMCMILGVEVYRFYRNLVSG